MKKRGSLKLQIIIPVISLVILVILGDLGISFYRESKSLKNELVAIRESEMEKAKTTLNDLVAVPFGIMEFYNEKRSKKWVNRRWSKGSSKRAYWQASLCRK